AGMLRGREKIEALVDADLFALPSEHENFGLVVIEALACGTPVIARRAGALPEVIRDGVDGFFGDDPAQMAYLLERVPSLDRMAIRRSAIERFSPSRMTDAYEEIYERRMRVARPLRTVSQPTRPPERGAQPVGDPAPPVSGAGIRTGGGRLISVTSSADSAPDDAADADDDPKRSVPARPAG
ncbi:MAG TPA: glycosyltransferase, partial [Candidatus Limnocylindrales bacterium]